MDKFPWMEVFVAVAGLAWLVESLQLLGALQGVEKVVSRA